MSNRRLPMPGEKPSTIWRPRFYRPGNRPTYRRPVRLPRLPVKQIMMWLVLAAIFFGARHVWLMTATHVTVLVNGQPVAVSTHRRTVEGAVRLAGVRIDETVYIQPPADTPLTEGMVITLGSLRPVIVHVDGQTLITRTHEIEPRAIIAALGIALSEGDAVHVERAMRPTGAEIEQHPELADAPLLPRQLRVMRPQQIIIHEINTQTGAQIDVSFSTTAQTLGRALNEAGYVLYEADRITPHVETRIYDATRIEAPLEVTIERSLPITVIADGAERPVRTHQTTVEALLDELGLALTGSDYSLPPLNAPIPTAAPVRIVRVREELLEEETPIPFETVYVPDPDLVLDNQREVDAGQAGTLVRSIRRRYEDGALVSEALIEEWVAEMPRPRIVAYGTQIVIQTIETLHGNLQYWRKLRVLATSYSPSTAGHKQEGDPFFGLSATGEEVVRGIIATDPRVIPLGINMYVPDYGPGRALDIGGAVKGFRIDLGYDDANLAYWNNWVDVYLLIPVPSPDEMIWVLPEK